MCLLQEASKFVHIKRQETNTCEPTVSKLQFGLPELRSNICCYFDRNYEAGTFYGSTSARRKRKELVSSVGAVGQCACAILCSQSNTVPYKLRTNTTMGAIVRRRSVTARTGKDETKLRNVLNDPAVELRERNLRSGLKKTSAVPCQA